MQVLCRFDCQNKNQLLKNLQPKNFEKGKVVFVNLDFFFLYKIFSSQILVFREANYLGQNNVSLLQIKQEVTGALNFLKDVYTIFGFSFQCNLSTRPDKYLGDIEMWNDAEKVCILFQY